MNKRVDPPCPQVSALWMSWLRIARAVCIRKTVVCWETFKMSLEDVPVP